ncbi:MAG: hypothetical protein AB1705_04760 [Verrucomicrobiota bacterium]
MYRQDTDDTQEWLGRHLLAIAFCLSLLFHLCVFGLVKVSPWFTTQWNKVFPPAPRPKATAQKKLTTEEALKRLFEARRKQEKAPPLMFVQVNPELAVTEPPPNARFYAAQSTVAANPDDSRDTDKPKFDGKQDQTLQLMNIPKPVPNPPSPKPASKERTELKPQPALKAEVSSEVQKAKEAAPKPKPPPGDLALARIQPQPKNGKADDGKGEEEESKRPRTIAEARARLENAQGGGIAGEKMKQDGGVKRRSVEFSLDAVGTPFGAYDQAVLTAIQQRWYDILDGQRYMHDRKGEVLLEFRMHADGRVTDMRTADQSVDDFLALLCQRAVLDPAPFPKWPGDMRRMIDEDFRDVKIRFQYR